MNALRRKLDDLLARYARYALAQHRKARDAQSWGGDTGLVRCECPCGCDNRGTFPAGSPRCLPCTKAGWIPR
jgi:hypothetical protein